MSDPHRERRFWRPDIRQDVDDELAFHLEMREHDFQSRGLAPADARAEAERRFGDRRRIGAECRAIDERAARERRRAGMLTDFIQDSGYALRSLRRSPGFALVAIVTLALGIGASAAIFSVVQQVLLRRLPYPAPDRLVDLTEVRAGRHITMSPVNFMDWRDGNRSLEGTAAYQRQVLTLTAPGDEPERVDAVAAEAQLFPVLGVRPAAGRVFTPEEAVIGGPKVAVLGDALWQRRFGRDPSIVGRTIALEGASYTVVGVMPAGFDFPDAAQLWVPLRFAADELTPNQRGAHYIRAIGRMKAGITLAQTRGDLDAIEQRIKAQFPDKLEGYSAGVRPMLDSLVGTVRRPLLVLLGAVLFLLLIACVNVSNLLLSRATTRTGEVAVRSALGASRGRIVRQLLTESVALAVAGGVAGLALAVWGLRMLQTLLPEDLPRGGVLGVDTGVLLFAIGLSVLAGVCFGAAPAVVASRPDLAAFLKDMRRGSGEGGGRRLRQALVAIELALALVLLAGAGLAMRSFDRLSRVDPGFDASANVLTFSIQLPSARYESAAACVRFFQDFRERLLQPGVQSAGAILFGPLSDKGFGGTFTIFGRAPGSDEGNAQVRPITPGYFETLGIPLLAGRTIDDRDRAGGVGVAVVSETAARQYWPNENPIGKRIRIHVSMGTKETEREIVGVVRDVRAYGLQEEIGPMIYVPVAQYASDAMTFVVRTAGDPLSALTLVKAQLRAVDDGVALSEVRPLDDLVAASISESRFRTIVLGLFASVSLVLAAVGLYGVMAFSVNQRRSELGIRMALGAHPRDVLRLVFRQGLLPVAFGVAAGLVGAIAITRVMRSLLFGVDAFDPLTFAAVACVLVSVAALACYVPARRATSVDPVGVLR
ncbi:MAG TPA: ABC transporter permease [Vicinamibacterales bacterium]|nr:ABC transporter permease [Vicinamibacterales bacterium]